MILLGYPAIGKSSISTKDPHCIDLPSTVFKIDGKRIDGWEKIYCKMAEDISKQHKLVLLTTHKEVREYFRNTEGEDVYIIYPSLELKDDWIKKLKNRYDMDSTDKNKLALERAINHYEDDVKDIIDMGKLESKRVIRLIPIKQINYRLMHLINTSILEVMVSNSRRLS